MSLASPVSLFFLVHPGTQQPHLSATMLAKKHLIPVLTQGTNTLWEVFYHQFHKKTEVATCLEHWVGWLREDLQKRGGLRALSKFITKAELAARHEHLSVAQSSWSAYADVVRWLARVEARKCEDAKMGPVFHKTWITAAINVLDMKYGYWGMLCKELATASFTEMMPKQRRPDACLKYPFYYQVSGCTIRGTWNAFAAYIDRYALSVYSDWVCAILDEALLRVASAKLRRRRTFSDVQASARWLREKFAGLLHNPRSPVRKPFTDMIPARMEYRTLERVPTDLLERVCPASDVNSEAEEEWRFLIFSARFGYARSVVHARVDLDKEWVSAYHVPRWLIYARGYILANTQQPLPHPAAPSVACSSTTRSDGVSEYNERDLPIKKRKRVLPQWMDSAATPSPTKRRPLTGPAM